MANKRAKWKAIRTAKFAGDVVSVDQLESPVPGFVGNPKGRATTKRYVGATVFADHFSGLTYMYLMSSISGDETLDAKQAFERFAAQHGIQIRHYHADNGRFAEQKFLEAVKTSN